MARRRLPSSYAFGLTAAVGAVVLFAGLPRPASNDFAPLALAAPLASWLSGLAPPAQPLASHPLSSGFARRLGADLHGGAEAIDLALRRLARDGSTPGDLARAMALALTPGRPLPEPSALRAEPAVPVRAIASLGAAALPIAKVSAENSSRFPPDLAAALADLIACVDRCGLAMAEKRKSVDAPLATLGRLAPALAAKGPMHWPDAATRALSALDRDAIADLEIDLADAVTRALPALERARGAGFLSDLRPLPDGGGIPRDLVFASECAAGLVLVGGKSDGVMPLAGAALAIDLGGDDLWHAGAGLGDVARDDAPAQLAIDLAGRDRWRSQRHGIAFGLLAVAAVFDLQGDDEYECEDFGLGCALGGSALLLDLDGDDTYRCARFGLGCAIGGAALVCDAAGDDRYSLDRFGLGAGSLLGVGALVDLRGGDVYTALGDPAAPSLAATSAHALGSSFAVAESLPAGSGILLDRKGDDAYRAACASLGSSDGFGAGVFLDGAGDDLYSGGADLLGSARGGYAFFRDLSGRDDFLARERSQGFGDAGIGVFVDGGPQPGPRGADDARTIALFPGQGVGARGGSGVFVRAGRPEHRETAEPADDSIRPLR